MRSRAPQVASFTAERRAAVCLALPELRVGEVLGLGAGGPVVAAEDPTTGRRLAVKVLLGDPPRTSEPAGHRPEVEVALGCRHPNLVRGISSREIDDMVLLVMERVDGPTVLDRHELEELDVRTTCGVAVAVARALHCAHELGFLHGDVKPQNVLYDDEGRHRLIDFGLARRWPFVRNRFYAGTPEYLAPEAIRPGGTVIPATDVFALGTMTYELLAGGLPYQSADGVENILRMHLDATPFPLRAVAPTLPPTLSDLVMAAVAPRVEDRIATALEFADRLTEIELGEGPITSPGHSSRQGVGTRGRSRR